MRYGGRFYINGEIVEACVEVADGKIVKVKKSMERCREIRGLILPGGSDIHVHFREPGYEYKEDFYTGSLSAAFGGITFVADMPNTKPAVTTPHEFNEKLDIVQRKANVDFKLFAMVTENTELYKFRTSLYKWYMYEHPYARIPKDGHITVHAELKECNKSSNSLKGYDIARPEKCEIMAVKKLLEINRNFHVAHISSIDTVDLCKIGKFTCEVTPHHLFLNNDMSLGAYGKVNPPLRGRWLSDMLWNALVNGDIDIVASDHAPHTVEEKDIGFYEAPPGIPEVETYLPIFLHLMKHGKITLKRLVEVIMEKPAELIGIRKGKIKPGYDADFIAINLSSEKKISEKDIHYKCGWTPYIGFPAIFPHTVFLRGKAIIEDYEILNEKQGEFIT